jgi:alkanesulfonate monooxygenase SsuD/methylene tetrahydromethanopterin reductase-like flavin-dependent oxidoreductase (luciferase family)
MKISLGIYPNQTPAEIIATGVLADELGFATLWMLDSHLLFREVYTLFGALAVSTKRIRLGSAVTKGSAAGASVQAG